jgi:CRP/FNR family transcriptional regulator
MYDHSCSNCAMSEICLPLGLDKVDIGRLEKIVTTSAVRHTGDNIVRQGDAFQNVYAVKSGMTKSYRFDDAGTEYIHSFHLPGELFGLDAIYAKRYGFTVEALDTVVLCEMNFEELQVLCSHVPSLQRQVFNLLSRDLYNSHVNPIEHFDQTAEQKLSGFLHNLLSRFHARGHVSMELHLPMSRRDIANHLGLAPETISRLLKRFQQQNVIDIKNRLVTIVDQVKLETMVHCHALEASITPSEITRSVK